MAENENTERNALQAARARREGDENPLVVRREDRQQQQQQRDALQQARARRGGGDNPLVVRREDRGPQSGPNQADQSQLKKNKQAKRRSKTIRNKTFKRGQIESEKASIGIIYLSNNQDSPPSNQPVGTLYFDTSKDRLRVKESGGWRNLD